jgi:1-pyrroline-5-carboxylate dehydrogenase
MLVQAQVRYASSHWKNFATIDPANLSPQNKGMNLVNGEWTGVEKYFELVDPLTGKPMISIPETSMQEAEVFADSLRSVPKSGLHNPFRNKERYLMLGAVCRKTAEVLHE